MKKMILSTLAALSLAGCTTQTEYGPCVGISDEKNPNLVYKIDVTNAVLGIVFIETIIVPIVILADETFCPIAYKAPAPSPTH